MKKIDLENGNINHLILRLFIPAIIGCFISALYNLINRFYIGQLNATQSEALTSLGIVTPISTLILAFSVLVGIGSSASISLKLGEKENETVDKILGNAIFLILLITIFITTGGLIFIRPILYGLGATEVSFPYAYDYLKILLIGACFNIFSNAFIHIIRGEGNTFYSTLIVVIGAILNIILDPILIFRYQLGLTGAAIATVISQFIMCLLVISYYFFHKSKIIIKLKNILPSTKIILLILSIGIAPFIMQSSMSLVNLTVNRSLKSFGGSQAIGAMAIINSIQAFIIVPILGISQGIQPIIGFNYGAKKHDRVKKSLKAGILLSSVSVTILFIIVQIFPKHIISFFNQDPTLIKLGSIGLRLYFLATPLLGFELLISHFFQSIKKAGISLLLTIVKQIILLIPLYIFLPRVFGIKGIWLSNPIADMLTTIITIIFYVREIHLLKKLTPP